MDTCFVGNAGFEIQPGAQESTSPDGRAQVTVSWRGPKTNLDTFKALWPAGSSDPLGLGYKLRGQRSFTREEGYVLARMTFEALTPIGAGAPEEVVIERGTTSHSVHLKIDGELTAVTYSAPEYSIEYTSASDPGSPSKQTDTGLTPSDKDKIKILETNPPQPKAAAEENQRPKETLDYIVDIVPSNFHRTQHGEHWVVRESWAMIIKPPSE